MQNTIASILKKLGPTGLLILILTMFFFIGKTIARNA